jgi:hypothetical protein
MGNMLKIFTKKTTKHPIFVALRRRIADVLIGADEGSLRKLLSQ